MVKDYNTSRKPLRLKEYGRNVHKIVEYIKSIDDKEQRTKYAHTITHLMRQIVPGPKDNSDGPQKFWDDMYIISDFDMDIENPYPVPEREILDRKPERLKYHTYKVKYKHYGHNLELLIKEAINMEEEEKQQNAIIYIGKLIKTFHMTWNNETIDDEVVLKVIDELSGGKLKLKEDLETVREKSLFEALYKEKAKGNKQRRNQGKGNQNRRRRN